MPYKDLEQKRQWEQEHRSERIARRRELRQIEAARVETQPETHRPHDARVIILVPLVAGAALAAYNPKLAMGAGGVALCLAAFYKKGGSWWFVAVLLIVFGLFFQWSEQSSEQ
jgi:hypothetical protein